MMLQAEKISKEYASEAGRLPVLQDLAIQMPGGSLVSIVGPSGAGKSTLLKIFGCIETPDGGILTIDDTDVTNSSKKTVTSFRREHISFVYQDYRLIEFLSIEDNVTLPLKAKGMPKGDIDRLFRASIDLVGMSDRVDAKTMHLSGGEKQRVAIARAIAKRPKVLLCDEPTGSLNQEYAESIFDLLVGLSKNLPCLVIVVTHNLGLAAKSDKVYELSNGQLLDRLDLNVKSE